MDNIMSNATKTFVTVIDGVKRSGINYRGQKLKHPNKAKRIIIGDTTNDQYFKDKYDQWPFSQGPIPAPDPKKNRSTHVDVVDTDLETVTRVYTSVAKTLDEIRDEQLELISRGLDSALTTISAGTTAMRRETWPLMAEQARLFKRKNSAKVKSLRKRAERRGITPAEMADKIIAKADIYEDAIGDAAGKEDLLLDQIKAAYNHPTNTDEQKIDAILAVEWV